MVREGYDLSNEGQSNRGGGSRRNSGQNRRRTGAPRRNTSAEKRPPQGGRGRSPGPSGGTATRPQAAAVVGKPAAPRKPSPITQNLTLSAWDMARTRTKTPDSPRGHIMTLRAHQRLVASFERERAIPDPDRSFLRVKEGNRGSILLIHGVGTGPGDLRELANFLFDHEYNVYVVRLPDYGTSGDTISEVSWQSALYQAQQCFDLLSGGGDRVHVVGMGFGAALALHLASGEKVASLVLLSPALFPKATLLQRWLVRLKLHRLKFVHRSMGWNAGLIEGMDRARGKVAHLAVPLYAAQCEDDDRASPASLRFLQRKSRHGSSRFQVFPTGGHAILAEHGPETLFDEIVGFCDVPQE